MSFKTRALLPVGIVVLMSFGTGHVHAPNGYFSHGYGAILSQEMLPEEDDGGY